MHSQQDVEACSDIVSVRRSEDLHSLEHDEDKKRDMDIEVMLDESKVEGDLGVTEDESLPQYISRAASSVKVNVEIVREITRTPSPTPSEAEVLKRKGMINYRSLLKWRFWLRKRWISKF